MASGGTVKSSETPLINDSREYHWNITVNPKGAGQILCTPRGDDPRFRYRKAHLPASSHPSLAAQLAWLAAPGPNERVWDPFCGCGAELIECSRLAEGLHLLGTDVSAPALAAAKVNASAADQALELRLQDALTADVDPVDVILANPPMGRRVARDGTVGKLLTDFVTLAAKKLRPRGRLVWVSPLGERTARAGRAAGLQVQEVATIDMGGFWVAVQIMTKLPRPTG